MSNNKLGWEVVYEHSQSDNIGAAELLINLLHLHCKHPSEK